MSVASPLQTEFKFQLPKGYLGPDNNLHRDGTMRLATAIDEILTRRDARVRDNPDYLPIVLLSRVITQLGSLTEVNPDIVEQFPVGDFAYLQKLYLETNNGEESRPKVTCPHCNRSFTVEQAHLGE
jgi:hypothetical protein